MKRTTKSVFRVAQLLFKLFMFSALPLSIFYTIYTRTPADFVTQGGKVAAFFFGLIILWVATMPLRIAIERNTPLYIPRLTLKWFLTLFAVASLVSLVSAFVYYSLGVAALAAWDELKNWKDLIAQKTFAIGIGGLVIVAVGLIFFWFRLRFRFIYGITEALAGTAFAMHRLGREPVIGLPSSDDFYFAMLTAGVYLVVRGFDNMHVGWKEQKDPLAKAMMSLGTETILVTVPPRRLKPNRVTEGRKRRPRH